jgi:hypothetical protein
MIRTSSGRKGASSEMTAVSPADVELSHEMLDRMALYNIVDKYRAPGKSFYTQKKSYTD